MFDLLEFALLQHVRDACCRQRHVTVDCGTSSNLWLSCCKLHCRHFRRFGFPCTHLHSQASANFRFLVRPNTSSSLPPEAFISIKLTSLSFSRSQTSRKPIKTLPCARSLWGSKRKTCKSSPESPKPRTLSQPAAMEAGRAEAAEKTGGHGTIC